MSLLIQIGGVKLNDIDVDKLISKLKIQAKQNRYPNTDLLNKDVNIDGPKTGRIYVVKINNQDKDMGDTIQFNRHNINIEKSSLESVY